MAEEQKNEQPVENKAEAPKKEQKPYNYKAKFIILGVLIAVLVVAVVLCIIFLGGNGDNETTTSLLPLVDNVEQAVANGAAGVDVTADVAKNLVL